MQQRPVKVSHEISWIKGKIVRRSNNNWVENALSWHKGSNSNALIMKNLVNLIYSLFMEITEVGRGTAIVLVKRVELKEIINFGDYVTERRKILVMRTWKDWVGRCLWRLTTKGWKWLMSKLMWSSTLATKRRCWTQRLEQQALIYGQLGKLELVVTYGYWSRRTERFVSNLCWRLQTRAGWDRQSRRLGDQETTLNTAVRAPRLCLYD